MLGFVTVKPQNFQVEISGFCFIDEEVMYVKFDLSFLQGFLTLTMHVIP